MNNNIVKNPLVSICIPVFNGGPLIWRALESCINQTYKNIEIIAVDNSSIDDTRKVIGEYAAKDKRIKYFRNEKTIPPVENFLKTVHYASGEYMQFLCHDDWLSKNYVEECIRKIGEFPRAAMISTEYISLKEGKNGKFTYLGKSNWKSGIYTSESILQYKNIGDFGNFLSLFRTADILNVEPLVFNHFNDEKYGEFYKKGLSFDPLVFMKLVTQYDYVVNTNSATYVKVTRENSTGAQLSYRRNNFKDMAFQFSAMSYLGKYIYTGVNAKHLYYWKRTIALAFLYGVSVNFLKKYFSLGDLLKIKNFFMKNDFSSKEIRAVFFLFVPLLFVRLFQFLHRKFFKNSDIMRQISDKNIFLKNGEFKI